MRNLFLYAFLLLAFSAKGQDIHLVKILNEEHHLDKSCDECRSKLSIPVTIPAHTAFIYLAISTNKTGHFNSIGLFWQLQDLTSKNSINILGDLKPLIREIKGYEKGGNINFYVATEGKDEGSNMFDRDQGYVCDYSKCMIDFPGGAAGFQVRQNEDKSIFYFGFDNPSDSEGLWFHVEAVAVTRDY